MKSFVKLSEEIDKLLEAIGDTAYLGWRGREHNGYYFACATLEKAVRVVEAVETVISIAEWHKVSGAPPSVKDMEHIAAVLRGAMQGEP